MLINLEREIYLVIFMHRKAVFFLAGIFLVVALVVPPVILLLQADKDLDNYITVSEPKWTSDKRQRNNTYSSRITGKPQQYIHNSDSSRSCFCCFICCNPVLWHKPPPPRTLNPQANSSLHSQNKRCTVSSDNPKHFLGIQPANKGLNVN